MALIIDHPATEQLIREFAAKTGQSIDKAISSAIRAADDATLLAVPGITLRHLHALRAAFPSSTPPGVESAKGVESVPEPTAPAERQPG